MHAIAIGALVIAALVAAASNVILLAYLMQSYHWTRRRPLAEVEPAVVRLRGRELQVDLDARTIEGWRRGGRALSIALPNGGEVRVGPFWIDAPAAESSGRSIRRLPTRPRRPTPDAFSGTGCTPERVTRAKLAPTRGIADGPAR